MYVYQEQFGVQDNDRRSLRSNHAKSLQPAVCSWAHLWLWPGAEQWRSFQFPSLPPEEQAPLWLHTPTAVPAEQQRDEWQQMSGCPCLYQLKKRRKKKINDFIFSCILCRYWCQSSPWTIKYLLLEHAWRLEITGWWCSVQDLLAFIGDKLNTHPLTLPCQPCRGTYGGC